MKKFTRIISAVLAFVLAISVFSAPVSAASKFKDVSTKTSGYKQIMWASDQGIINGFKDGTFKPTSNCTRAQLAVMLWRFNGEPEANGPTSFTDIGNYSENVRTAIKWAYLNGIVTGFENGKYYKPEDPVTRQQMAIMLWRMAGKPSVSTSKNPFSDIADCSSGVKKAIIWLAGNNISKGVDGKFAPYDNCTRAQLAIFLFRYKFNLNFNSYTAGEVKFWYPKNLNYQEIDMSSTDYDFGISNNAVMIFGEILKKSDLASEHRNYTAYEFAKAAYGDNITGVARSYVEVDDKLFIFEYIGSDGTENYFYEYGVFATKSYYTIVIYCCRQADSGYYQPMFLEWLKAADY